MFGWLRTKTEAERLEERIDRIEAEVVRVAKERADLEARAASEVARRRAAQGSLGRVKARLALGAGLAAGACIGSALWAKTIFFVSLTLAQFFWITLGAVAAGWLVVHLAWPDPQT